MGGVPEPDNCSFKTLFFTAEAGNSTAPWSGSPIIVPSKFIMGDLDITYNFTGIKEYIEWGFKENVPLLKEVVVLEGVGHFLQEEKADEINNSMTSFRSSDFLSYLFTKSLLSCEEFCVMNQLEDFFHTSINQLTIFFLFLLV